VSVERVPFRIVLDTSAVAAYTRASIAVGEILSEITDEQGVALLPLPCLVEAAHTVNDPARLDLLVAHAAVVIYPGEPDQWRTLAAMYGIVGRLDAAMAALLALDAVVAVLTDEPGLYAGVDTGGLTIPIDDE
jgi:hypothetical protein